MISHASSLSKEKKIQTKRNIKSRKIDKRKRKMLVLICIIITNFTKYTDLVDDC